MEKEKQKNFLDQVGLNFHRKLSFKLITIGFLVIILLIPKLMVLSLITERSANAETAINEVMSKWSNNQTITGPILTVPFKKIIFNENEEKYKEVIQTATFLPKKLNINGEIFPKKLYRNIYDVVVYESDITLEGNFEMPDFSGLDINVNDILWENAQVLVAISDLRGINEEVSLNWNKTDVTFSPGMKTSAIGISGISANFQNLSEKDFPGNFQISIQTKGSENIMFTPVGEKTNVKLYSDWNDPSFIGNFLPNTREIDETGFKANWSILHFNRNFPQHWIDDGNFAGVYGSKMHDSDFGVELITMANHYQKNMRSAKYAILIVIITFIVFFMYEVFSKHRIHAFQYIMVGSGITIFYLLLLSISEHLGFNLAYLIASIAVLLLVILYTRSFMPKLKNSIGVGLAMGASYGFIFILLQIEDYALLAGSISLFILLALLMYFTRKINWYNE